MLQHIFLYVIDLNPNTTGLTLEERVDLEKTTFHWYPYQRILYHELADGSLETFERECRYQYSSIDEFPQFFTRKLIDFFKAFLKQTKFTGEQRLQGVIALHFVIALYLFIVLAFICDKYFLPSVERICQVLGISPVSVS